MRGRGRQSRPPSLQAGSVLMLTLFVCLAVAVVIQTLAAVTLCAERALADEQTGRELMAEKDEGLACLGKQAMTKWGPQPWSDLKEEPNRVEGYLSQLGTSGWVMEAATRQDQAISPMTISAWIERGRDGIDLPLAAVVAGGLRACLGRELEWVDLDQSDEEVTTSVCVVNAPDGPLLGAGCALERLAAEWKLDPGWQQLLGEGVVVGPRVLNLHGRSQQTLSVADELVKPIGVNGALRQTGDAVAGASAESAVLVLVLGGADLDARNLGDFYGAIVVDGGSIRLDGTTLHGALFVTDTVDLGGTGRVLFSRPVLRWATDRSLDRTRLVPGTRSEGTK